MMAEIDGSKMEAAASAAAKSAVEEMGRLVLENARIWAAYHMWNHRAFVDGLIFDPDDEFLVANSHQWAEDMEPRCGWKRASWDAAGGQSKMNEMMGNALSSKDLIDSLLDVIGGIF